MAAETNGLLHAIMVFGNAQRGLKLARDAYGNGSVVCCFQKNNRVVETVNNAIQKGICPANGPDPNDKDHPSNFSSSKKRLGPSPRKMARLV